MSKFRIKNEKGLFIEMRWQSLISSDGLEALKKYGEKLEDPAEKSSVANLVAHFFKLPEQDGFIYLTPNDKGIDMVKYKAMLVAKAAKKYYHDLKQHSMIATRGWFQPSSPKAASDLKGVACQSLEAAGWLDVQAVFDLIAWNQQHFDQLGLAVPSEYQTKGAKAAKAKAKNNVLVFEPIEKAQELASAPAWALFVGKGENDGFLDDKGYKGPLARARLFESAAAAGRTAKSRGLTGWKVVKASIELVGMEAMPGDSEFDALSSAMALREQQWLSSALEKADVERLQARLAELLGQTEAPAAPKKRSNSL